MLVHNEAINRLAPADYQMIEKEHELLKKYLSDLHQACACSHSVTVPNDQSCNQGKQTSCQGRLPSFLFYIIDLAAIHFDHEEKIMLSRPQVNENYEYFQFHHQAHIDLMQNLQALADEYLSIRDKENIAGVYRHYYEKISDLFEQHDRLFDDPFITSTKI
jgi:hemerythrin